jgi:hypothetical protein
MPIDRGDDAGHGPLRSRLCGPLRSPACSAGVQEGGHLRGLESEPGSLAIAEPHGAQLVGVAVDPLVRAAAPTRHVAGVKQRRILAEQLDHAAGDLLDQLVGDRGVHETVAPE